MLKLYETIIILVLALGLYLAYNRFKKGVGQEMILAMLISAAWVGLSGLYDYRDENIVIFGISMFPFICWTFGLVLLREIYEKIKGKDRWLKASAIYVVLLAILEYIGYNYLHIQLASDYSGLFGIEMMHMPWWGQLYYLAIGPVYLKITDYMRVK